MNERPWAVITSENLSSRIINHALASSSAITERVGLVCVLPNAPMASPASRRRAIRWMREADPNFIVLKAVEIYGSGLAERLLRCRTHRTFTSMGVETRRFSSARDPSLLDAIQRLDPEWIISTGPSILPPALFPIPRRGILNIHGARIPEFRGMANYVHVLLAGCSENWASLQLMHPEIDAGPVIAEQGLRIDPRWSAFRLAQETARVQASLLRAFLESWTAEPDPSKLTPLVRDAESHYRSFPPRGTRRALRRVGRSMIRLGDLQMLTWGRP